MVTRGDLTDIGDADYSARQGEYILCQHCGDSFGGTQGDYWQVALDEPFQCSECGSTDLALVKDKTEIVTIKQ